MLGVCEFTSDDYEVRISPSLGLINHYSKKIKLIQLELVENVPPKKGLRLRTSR